MNIKGPLLISVILMMSFAWGYKKDEIRASLSKAPELAPVPVELAPVVEQQSAEPAPNFGLVAKPPEAKQPSIQLPPPAPPSAATVAPVATAPTVPEYVQPANPYEELSKKLKSQQGNITETFDSIRRSQVDEKQAMQKNAYFRKLSDQLKELQGQPPPAPVPGAPVAPPPPAATDLEANQAIADPVSPESESLNGLTPTGAPVPFAEFNNQEAIELEMLEAEQAELNAQEPAGIPEEEQYEDEY